MPVDKINSLADIAAALKTENPELYGQSLFARCEDWATTGKFGLPWYDENRGDENNHADIMFIGLDFGRVFDVEYEKTNPGKDPSYNRLVEVLKELRREFRIYCTNTSYYLRDSDEDVSGNSYVHKSEYWDASRLYLKKEIELVQPRLIISLGNDAYTRLIELFDITGKPYNWLDVISAENQRPPILVSYHPSPLNTTNWNSEYIPKLVAKIRGVLSEEMALS